LVLTLPLSRATNDVAEKIKAVLGQHPGVTEVKLTQPGRSVLMRLDDTFRVTASPAPAMFGDLKALLGPACLT